MAEEPRPSFTPTEERILRIVQDTLPDSPAPFARIAEIVGVTEQEVIDLLQRLKASGAIRRFGATLRHQEAGYGANVMVAWFVDGDQDIEEVSRIMASRPEITHCYQRRNCYDWPYNLYTMVHAKTREECLNIVRQLQAETGLSMYEMLFSHEELKKTSMRYF
jgi:DNA-binding Lrp family transcriptional regulator